MMKAPCSSGRCVMRADHLKRLIGATLLLCMGLAGLQIRAAEAPIPTPTAADAVLPLPPEAEAAHQDLSASERSASGRSMDEAIFTEISPLTIPEIGIALPEDQDH